MDKKYTRPMLKTLRNYKSISFKAKLLYNATIP